MQRNVIYSVKKFSLHRVCGRNEVRTVFEKNLKIGYLLDFYGDVLSERKRLVLDRYYNDDLSLSEIAEELSISRQGVRELIKHAEEELLFYEEKLHLAERFGTAKREADKLLSLLDDAGIGGEIHASAEALFDAVK